MALGHALQDVPEIGERLDVVELCRGNERADGGPSLSATVGAGEQMVLAPPRVGSRVRLRTESNASRSYSHALTIIVSQSVAGKQVVCVSLSQRQQVATGAQARASRPHQSALIAAPSSAPVSRPDRGPVATGTRPVRAAW
jgi:hypothetical protein